MKTYDWYFFVFQILPSFLKQGVQALQLDKKEFCNVKPLLSQGQILSGTKKTAGMFLPWALWFWHALNILTSVLQAYKHMCSAVHCGLNSFDMIFAESNDVHSYHCLKSCFWDKITCAVHSSISGLHQNLITLLEKTVS